MYKVFVLFLVDYFFLYRSFAYLYDIDVKDKGGVRTDLAHVACTVCERVRNEKLDFSAFTHELQTLGPALDNAVEHHLYRLFGLVAGIELGTVDKSTGIVNIYGILRTCLYIVSGFDNLVLETALSNFYAYFLSVLAEELLADLLVYGSGVLVPCADVLVEQDVHKLRVHIELGIEFRAVHVAFSFDEVHHSFLDLCEVQVFSEVVVLDEVSEVYTDKVAH